MTQVIITVMEVVPDEYAEFDKRAFELIQRKDFGEKWRSLVPSSAPAWLSRLKGPSTQAMLIREGRHDWIVVRACKPHACAWNRVWIFIPPHDLGKLVAYVEQDPDEDGPKKSFGTWLGKIDARQKQLLQMALRKIETQKTGAGK